jgi:hypothetical protein
MKALVVQTLINDPLVSEAVTTSDTEARVYSITALGREGAGVVPDIPAMPVKPFIIVMEFETTPFLEVQQTSRAANHPFRINVYDVPGDYERINQVLKAAREALLLLSGVTSVTGVRCTNSRWTGFSQELHDPDYDANFRYASFVLTASD